jgi:hypothetical protein
LEDSIISSAQEWNFFPDDDHDPSRVGQAHDPFSASAENLFVKVTGGNHRKDQLLNLPFLTPKDECVSRMSEWGSLMGLKTSAISKAQDMFSRLKEKQKSFKGKNLDHIAAAMLWCATRELKLPYKLSEFENHTNIKEKDIGKSVQKIFGEGIRHSNSEDYASS